MPRYYFDTWDGELFVKDDDGSDLAGIEQARNMVLDELADIARHALPGAVRRELAVELSDEQRRPVLRASMWFEAAADD